ncbi:hypothetical protein JW887_05495 [Candidatus Dojkabacteria bacterium]|nr:hypothetical protein [Candidatus Dojkabacteria bacterium]
MSDINQANPVETGNSGTIPATPAQSASPVSQTAAAPVAQKKKPSVLVIVLIVLLVVGLLGCCGVVIFFLFFADSGSGWLPSGQEVALSDVCSEDYDGKKVVLEGYVKLSDYVYCDSACELALYSRPNERGENYVTALVDIGDGSNQMDDLPSDFYIDDLVIRDNDGNEIGHNNYVKVTGYFTYDNLSEDDPECSIAVDTIEKLDMEDGVSFLDDATKIDTGDFCNSKYDDELVAMDGYVELPYFLYCGSECDLYIVDELGTNSGDGVNAYFLVGDQPGYMEELPDNYLEEDLVVYDIDGNAVSYGDKVTVVGTQVRNSTGDCDFYVEEVITK